MLHRLTCNIFNKKHKDDETDVHVSVSFRYVMIFAHAQP